MLTPKDIKFIVDWAEAGNEPRHWRHDYQLSALRALGLTVPCARVGESKRDRPITLNPAGLTIAALAKALEQANAVADDLRYSPDETFGPSDELRAAFETMCRTKKELLG